MIDRAPSTPAPPITAVDDVATVVRARGFAVVDAAGLATIAGVPSSPPSPSSPSSSSSSWPPFDAWRSTWADLPLDAHMKDGGRYRFRRHASFVVDASSPKAGGGVERVPHRAHFQSTAYNALHGGIERWFAPIVDDVVTAPAFHALLGGLARLATRCRAPGDDPRWYVEAHQFRIAATDGLGRPTPEGAHRDGVDLAVVVLVDRENVAGGETRVFDIDGPAGVRFTLSQPWSALVLDDARVIHETTPIRAIADEGPATRDTLVVTLRKDGFQAPAGTPVPTRGP